MKRYIVLAGDNQTKGWNSYMNEFDSLRDSWVYCAEIKNLRNIEWIQIINTENKQIVDRFKIVHYENGVSSFVSERDLQDLDFL